MRSSRARRGDQILAANACASPGELGDHSPALGINGRRHELVARIGLIFHGLLGELAPKSAAIARTQAVALVVAPPMRAFYLATKPFVDLFNAMGNLLLKPFGIPPASEAGHVPHTETELRALLRESSEQGLIEQDDQRLTESVFAFGDRRVREIMRPRPEIAFLTLQSGVEEAVRLARATGHTRFPLCDATGGLDAARGVVHVKDGTC